ncbi:MAG: response regulator transcription factor [Bacilli bacterium]|nr:response regulator transcription factor [Bacilli bacterium]
MIKICLVEDEKALSTLLKTYLEKEDYSVDVFSKGQDVLDKLDSNCKYDLYILDIMLEDDITGYDIIKKIREKDDHVPVIFSSARDESIDKIVGLEMGSDDYIAKPYSPKELVLRVNNIVKRTYKSDYNNLTYNDYVIDVDKRVVKKDDKIIDLTTLEFDMFLYFVNNKGKSIDRETILNSIWGDDYFGSDRVVDDLIRRLRKKLNIDLNTIYGYGYRLV